MALTKAQLDWARRVYTATKGYLMCHFPVYSEKTGWGFCGSTSNIHIHHLNPQGFCQRVLGINPDVPDNLIALCAMHHVGKGYKGSLDWRNDVVYVVHTDMSWAYQMYSVMGKESFDKVFKGRKDITAKGKAYWNTDWDRAMKMIAQETVSRYQVTHPEDPFPSKR